MKKDVIKDQLYYFNNNNKNNNL